MQAELRGSRRARRTNICGPPQMPQALRGWLVPAVPGRPGRREEDARPSHRGCHRPRRRAPVEPYAARGHPARHAKIDATRAGLPGLLSDEGERPAAVGRIGFLQVGRVCVIAPLAVLVLPCLPRKARRAERDSATPCGEVASDATTSDLARRCV